MYNTKKPNLKKQSSATHHNITTTQQTRTEQSHVISRHAWVVLLITDLRVKGKVFPYSLPSVGPGADPGVQAVSPQVT